MREIPKRKQVKIHIIMPVNSFRVAYQQSVNLSPLVGHLWGHLKTLVYTAPIQNEETLHQSIFDAGPTIRNRSWTFERSRHSMISYIHACIDSGGGNMNICSEM